MMMRFGLLLMVLALSGCAVVHESDHGMTYGTFGSGWFDAGGLIFSR